MPFSAISFVNSSFHPCPVPK